MLLILTKYIEAFVHKMNKRIILSSNTLIISCLIRTTSQLLIETLENLLYSPVFSI